MKIQITLEDIDHDYLVACLERYMEKMTDAGEMRTLAKLIERVDEDYKEID